MSALFSGGRGGGGGSSGGAQKALVEFRAGKMSLGANNMVTPDKRKGLIMVDQSEDQLMHFKWKDRQSGNVEDDLIIFPDDIEFKKVSQCTTGRVFILKFKSSSRKMFFWMQEPKDDKDEEYCKKVNDFLNNPPAPGSSRGGGGGSGGSGPLGGLDLSNLGDSELQSLLNNMSQQQLMQLFGGGLSGGMGGLAASLLGSGGGSGRQRSSARGSSSTQQTSSTTSTTASSTTASATTTTASTPTTTSTSSAKPASSSTAATTGTTSSSGAPIQLSDLQNILSGIQVPPGEEGGAAAAKGVDVDLASEFTAELMKPLLSKPEFIRRMKELLPQEHQNNDFAEEIKGTVQSPQFKQALNLFFGAFRRGELGPLIVEFGLGPKAVEAAASGNIEQFISALQSNKDKKKEDQPEDMALD